MIEWDETKCLSWQHGIPALCGYQFVVDIIPLMMQQSLESAELRTFSGGGDHPIIRGDCFLH
jgi:hypothetical protein